VLGLYRRIEEKTAAAAADELRGLEAFLASEPPSAPH